MKKEKQLKTVIWIFIISDVASLTAGFIMNQWMTGLGGLALLIGAAGAYTNIRIMRIEDKIGMRRREKDD
jgi:hypothetical protein